MKYLLIMSLSGSTMVGIYLLLRYLLRDKMPARLQYLLVKAAMLYYLIPLPYVKGWYTAIVERLLSKRGNVSKASAVWAGCMVHADERIYLNGYLKAQMLAVALWMTFAVMWLLYELNDYCRTRRRVISCADHVTTKEERVCPAYLKKRCGVKRNVTVYKDDTGGKTITFGFFKPIILCDQSPDSREAELLLSHELIHIRRLDVWWKMLMQCVILLHWWNPVAWILYLDFERACEWSCDETVVEHRTKDEVKRYLNLLILESVKDAECGRPYQRWATGFGSGSEKLRKRMENVMRMKKWNKAASGAVVAALVLANSLTVFAYEDTIQGEPKVSMTQSEVEYFMEGDVLQFIPDEVETEVMEAADLYIPYIDEIRYEKQFVDAEGNIYEVLDEETISSYRSCNHTYVSGREAVHDKKSDGSCLVKVYDADRCSKCGYLLIGELISETKYTKCPH